MEGVDLDYVVSDSRLAMPGLNIIGCVLGGGSKKPRSFGNRAAKKNLLNDRKTCWCYELFGVTPRAVCGERAPILALCCVDRSLLKN